MGYCHYYTRLPEREPKDAYGRFVMDAITIIREATKHGIVVRNGVGQDQPEVNEGYIFINGDAAEASYGTLTAFADIEYKTVPDGSHETFAWVADARPLPDFWNIEEYEQTGEVFNSVKTNEKPYDAVVCALLIAAKKHYGDSVRIGSDGDWNAGGWIIDAGWVAGRELYEKALGEQAICPMNNRL